LDDRGIGVPFPTATKDFPLFHNVQTGYCSLLYNGEPGTVSSGIKRLGREADYSSPNIEVKNSETSTSIPSYVFMAWSLIN
jgi:hypothetical protein